MRCSRARTRLEELFAESEAPEMPEPLRSHVDRCASCRAFFEELRAAQETMRRARGALEEFTAPPPSAEFIERAMTSLPPRLPARRPTARRIVRRFVRTGNTHAGRLGLFAAAAALLLFAGILWSFQRPERRLSAGPAVEEGPEAAPVALRSPAAARAHLAEKEAAPPLRFDKAPRVALADAGREAPATPRPRKGLPSVPPEPGLETERPVGRLTFLEGPVHYKRAAGAKWFRAAEGVHLQRGDSVDTRTGGTRIQLEQGSTVWCNKGTWATFEEARVHLHRGEAYCEIIGEETGFELISEDGVVRHLGTRFSVKVTAGGTTVTVEEGKVEVRNERGKVVVEGGSQVRVRRGFAPGKPRKANVEAALAWVGGLVPRSAAVFFDDFSASPVSRWPRGWKRHATEASLRSGFAVLEEPGRPGERFIGCPRGSGSTQHAFIPFKDWSGDFKVSLRVRMSGERQVRAGLQLEGPEKRRCLSVHYDARRRVLVAEERATSRLLQSVPLDLGTGRWHAFEVAAVGERFICRVDGKEVVNVSVPALRPVARVSLLSRGADSAQFDDVKVLRLAEGLRR